MKRLSLFLLLVAFSAAVSNAQIRPDAVKPISENEVYWNSEYANLLNQQNARLDSRRTAMTVSLAGAGLAVVGTFVGVATAEVNDGNATLGLPGVAIMAVGELTTAVGGVWFLINEFNMIKAQKRLNEHLLLKYGPTGVALSF